MLYTAADAFSNPAGLTLDEPRNALYWVESGRIMKAQLDAGAVTTIDPGVTEATMATGVALDLGAQQVYWTDNGTDALARANYDGSGKTRLYQSAPFDPGVMDGGTSTLNFTNPQGVALIP